MRRFAYFCGAIFILISISAFAQEASPSDEIVIKAADAVMFQLTANMKLTEDQISAIRPIVVDRIVKERNIYLSLKEGNIDGKTLVTQRLQVINDENRALAAILSPDQMKIWLNMPQYQ